jgi:hypothetical protein
MVAATPYSECAIYVRVAFILLFISLRIRIQKAKPMWILVRLLSHKKLNFYIKNILEVGNR